MPDVSPAAAYWRANLRVLAQCLLVWVIVSFLLSVILVDVLNTVRLGGYPLGFWFAQQGSLYTFIVLIFYYAWRMNRLDRQFHFEEDDEESN